MSKEIRIVIEVSGDVSDVEIERIDERAERVEVKAGKPKEISVDQLQSILG